MSRRYAVPLALVLGALVASPATAAAARLPLGPKSLTQTQTWQRLAPGVRYVKIVRGTASSTEVWTVTATFTATRAEADAAAARLQAAGFPPRVEPFGRSGYAVRTGSFATKDEATAQRSRVVAAGFPSASADFTGEDGRRTSGPWVVQVLRVDPERFHGRVRNVLGTGVVPGRETVTSMTSRLHALAGVNGGYFVVTDADGTEGDLAGLSIIRGRPVSEAVNGRTSLVIRRGLHAAIQRLSTRDALRSSDGATRELDGLNRGPGLIRACGGVGGDQPTERALHDISCTDDSEVIRYGSFWGPVTPSGPGFEAVLDGSGRVTAVREARGGPVPAGGSVLAGTGDGATWLRDHAQVGRQVRARVRVVRGGAASRRSMALRRTGIVNGGPRLLKRGHRDITGRSEGFHHPADPSFFWKFGVRRNPRTMAGITRRGRLLLVTVDGHQPGWSLGLSFPEEARLMRALGARDAVNLDGGGSTTLSIHGQLANRPSDATGERPVGDAILLEP
jgi:Phosphodiester glycosidase/SPOR domain